uniref:Uncharacterized protein n=1 Tax=Aegilops tauschii subsp. strangulata TaxID=200361 RepID=A0A453M523_AEGTS
MTGLTLHVSSYYFHDHAKHNAIFLEDFVHEILNINPHFKEGDNFVWPFKIKALVGGLK